MQSSRFEGSGASDVFFGKEPFCVMESAIILDKPVSLHFVLVFCKCLNSNELNDSLWRSLTKDNRLIH